MLSFNLIALLSCSVVTIGVGEVDVTACDFHHLLYVPTSFSNDMGMLCESHVHLQSHLVHLLFTQSRDYILTLKQKVRKCHF